MRTYLGKWIEENAGLFRYSADILPLKKNAEKILLSGGVASCLSGVFRTLYPNSQIIAVDTDSKMLDEGKAECNDLVLKSEAFNTYISNDSYDIAISLLSIQSLNTRELTPYLYNLYDSLKKRGVLYISFPDAIAPTHMEKNLYPAWYDQDERVYMKYYMVDDVMRALKLIGFDINAIEADDNAELGHVVSLICTKR